MVIAVDAMGGDHAPEAIVTGALRSAPQVQGEIALVGAGERLEALLPGGSSRPRNIRVVDAPEVIGMGEDPGKAVRAKPDSSLAVCVNLLRDGEADAAVSAGNSGAFMFLAQVRLRKLPGLQRSAIAVLLPGPDKPRILLDLPLPGSTWPAWNTPLLPTRGDPASSRDPRTRFWSRRRAITRRTTPVSPTAGRPTGGCMTPP